MPVRFQLVIDCADPDRLARFWATALGYELAPAPAGFATWNDFYRELNVPEGELVDGADRISDPEGHGPGIWFHVVPDAKAVKNRLHLDIHARASGRIHRDSQEASRRGGQATGRPGRHHHWRIVRGRARPLRGRDEGPGRQRVRYQLTVERILAGHSEGPGYHLRAPRLVFAGSVITSERACCLRESPGRGRGAGGHELAHDRTVVAYPQEQAGLHILERI